MDTEQDSPDEAIEYLNRHINALGPDVQAIHVTAEGDLISVSSDPKDDQTTCVYYLPLDEFPVTDRFKTVLRTVLIELDRIMQNVDLVSYKTCGNGAATRKAVFKYYFLSQFLRATWRELHILLQLPQHPNLLPLDRVVLDELRGRVVGFTTPFISGDTVRANVSRVFKLDWLRQLMGVTDDLNFKHGIAHQDVAGRSLLVDPETDDILPFDFNFSGQIGGNWYADFRDDVKGVIFTLYEIITRDTSFREVDYPQQNPASVQGLDEWVQHPDVKFDHPVSEYRSVLDAWVKTRREGKQINHYTEAPEYIDWPADITPPPKTILFHNALTGKPVEGISMVEMRREKRAKGNAILNWERPPQCKLKDGDQVLASGQLLSSTECTDSDDLKNNVPGESGIVVPPPREE